MKEKKSIIHALEDQLKGALAMNDLGSTEHILGMTIKRDRQQQLLYVFQKKYIEKAPEMYITKALSVSFLPHVEQK